MHSKNSFDINPFKKKQLATEKKPCAGLFLFYAQTEPAEKSLNISCFCCSLIFPDLGVDAVNEWYFSEILTIALNLKKNRYLIFGANIKLRLIRNRPYDHDNHFRSKCNELSEQSFWKCSHFPI